MAKLYLVPTPVGNLDDITLRAINVLGKVAVIAAEDTRRTRILLEHLGIKKTLVAYHEHNEEKQVNRLIARIKKGDDLALVSDAGSPGISDPGFLLVRKALERDVQVEALPGATAFVPVLTASGLASDKFVFVGFLPKKMKVLDELMDQVRDLPMSLVVYESPYRAGETLKTLLSKLGDRRACVGREISKKFETYYRGELSQLVEVFTQDQLAGELVIIVEGKNEPDVWSEEKIMKEIETRLEKGVAVKQIAKDLVPVVGRRKSELYNLGIKVKGL